MVEMEQWQFAGYGVDNLSLVRTLRPTPKSGEALVEVEAVSLNYRDHLIAQKGLGTNWLFPFVPGSDMAGRVVEMGPEVKRYGWRS